MDDNELKVGDALLTYMNQSSDLASRFVAISGVLSEAVQLLESGEAYEGNAYDLMKTYFDSLAAHAQKMVLLYIALMQYTQMTYTESYYNEQQIINMIQESL